MAIAAMALPVATKEGHNVTLVAAMNPWGDSTHIEYRLYCTSSAGHQAVQCRRCDTQGKINRPMLERPMLGEPTATRPWGRHPFKATCHVHIA